LAGFGKEPKHGKPMTGKKTQLKQAAIINTLRTCRLFSGLSAEDLRSVTACTRLKELAKGDYLFHEGQESEGFYIIQSGTMNIHRVNAAGKEQVIHIFRAGDSFAEGALASDRGYPAEALALEPSRVLLVRKTGFMDLVNRQPSLALRMLGSMSIHLRMLVSQLEDMTLKDVETRLANWLVKRCPDPLGLTPVPIHLPVTKRVLAAELGTVSETFSRTLAKFRTQGLLTVKGRTVTVHRPKDLSDQLQQLLRA